MAEIRKKIKLRTGTAAQRPNVTPAEGEPVWITDDKKLYVGDGVTAGGIGITADVPEASTIAKGIVKLAGDLGGTADAPSVNSATTTTKGIVKLAGDLGGTADLPTVVEATATTKGTIQLAGDLGGTASAPTVVEATASVKGKIQLAGVLSGTADAPALANSGVTAGTYNGANVTVGADGRLTAASAGVCAFTLTVVPAFGLASAPCVIPFAMNVSRIDITSKTAAGADQAPSSSTDMAAYKNGSSALTQAFTTANTTNSSVSLALAAGDVVYLLQSAANGTAQVSMTFRGVRA